ncbi:MAG TPA: ArsR family transcriptional regulator [Pseudonocardiaceae bacterium]|nr:ArsR family transcriptional regulator [Pseudonocardiaceae bacterium]
MIILLLRAGAARSVGEIAAQLELSPLAVSHHLKILRDTRLLTVERKGTQRRCSQHRRVRRTPGTDARTRQPDHSMHPITQQRAPHPERYSMRPAPDTLT